VQNLASCGENVGLWEKGGVVAKNDPNMPNLNQKQF
jgi:hypothetical protein